MKEKIVPNYKIGTESKLGDIAKASDLGKKGLFYYIWYHCIECKQDIRWKRINKYGEIRNEKCHTCANTGENNGMYGRTHAKEVRDAISKRFKGKKRSKEAIEKGALKRMGIPLSEEHKEQIKLTLTGYKHTKKARKNMSESRKGEKSYWYGKHLSEQTKKIMSESKIGKNNPNWKGENAITQIVERIRKSLMYFVWRFSIYKRDNYQCRICKSKSNRLVAHHIIHFSKVLHECWSRYPLLDKYESIMMYSVMWNISNGITVCEECHIKIHVEYINKIKIKYNEIIKNINYRNIILIDTNKYSKRQLLGNYKNSTVNHVRQQALNPFTYQPLMLGRCA